jgi:hypothetical protein
MARGACAAERRAVPEVQEMKQGFVTRAVLASLVSLGVSSLSDALAQGLPTPGPGGTYAAGDGGTMVGPTIAMVVILVAAIVVAVTVADLRRKRRSQAIAIEGQVSDALMREPRLTGSMLVAVAQVPLAGRRPPTVEIRGQVEYPELREIAVRLVRQEVLRHHPDGRVEDRIFVSPPVPAGRR